MKHIWMVLLVLFGFAAPSDAQTLRADRFQYITGACTWTSGSGAPNGVRTGSAPCDFYIRTDAPGGLYQKVTGTATNTGWVIVAGSTGTVTSVALTAPPIMAVSGSPVTTAGTFVLTWLGAANCVPYFTATNVVGCSANYTFDGSTQSIRGTNGTLLIQGAFGDLISTYAAGDALGPLFTCVKKRGTLASPAIAQANDLLCTLRAFGATSAGATAVAASITFAVDGTPGVGDMPGRIGFSTTADGVSSPTEHLRISNAGNVGHPSYTSQTSNWQVTAAGAADYRYLFADELRIKLFSAEEQAVYRASLMVTRSFSEVAQAFTCPAAAGTQTLWVRDAATLADARVFTASNWVALRTYVRSDTDADGAQELVVGDCVGQVTAYADGSGAAAGQQSWTFTRGAGGSAGTLAGGAIVPVGNVAIDFGVAGNGIVELNAYDGTEGENAPYLQTKTWATAPVAANFSVTSRMGNLSGAYGYTSTSCAGSLPCYGFAAGNSAASNFTLDPTNGFRLRTSTTVRLQLAADGSGSLATNAISWNTSGVMTIGGWTIDATSISATNIALTSGAANAAHILVGAGAAACGLNSALNSASVGIWCGSTYVNRSTAPFRVEADGSLIATDATITGAITASSGTIGSFTIGTYLYSGSKTAYNDANAGVHLGSDGIGFGNNLFTVSAAGAMTAVSGTIGGWSIAATTLSATNVTLTSGAANTANILAGTGANAGGLNSANAGGDIFLWGGSTHANRATAPFRVTAAGSLTSTSATITGSITATAGAIGGCTIAATSITCGSGFSVTNAGVLSATSGTVGGWTLGASTLTSTNVGLNSAVTGGLDYRIYIGDSTPASAEFSVDETGYLRSTAGTFGGGSSGVDIDTSGLVVNGSGRILAGGGDVLIDNNGITITAGGSGENQLKWSDGGLLTVNASSFMTLQSAGVLFITSLNETVFSSIGGIFLGSVGTTTSAEYPVVSATSDGGSTLRFKTDGLNTTSTCGAGQYVDAVTAELGIFISASCSTPFGVSELAAVRAEVVELRRLVQWLMADRKLEGRKQ